MLAASKPRVEVAVSDAVKVESISAVEIVSDAKDNDAVVKVAVDSGESDDDEEVAATAPGEEVAEEIAEDESGGLEELDVSVRELEMTLLVKALSVKARLVLSPELAVALVRSAVVEGGGSVEAGGVDVTEELSGKSLVSLVDAEVVELELESLLVCRSRNVRKNEAAISYITVALVGEVGLKDEHRKSHEFL